MRKKFPPLKNELDCLYCSEHLTTYEIARLTGFSQRAVHYWMKKYGIEGRKNSESHCKRVKIELSPTLAYVLGVCYGDGSVHKV